MARARAIAGWAIRLAAIGHLSLLVFLLFWAAVPAGLANGRTAVLISGSMMPSISQGDVVVYDRIAAAEVKVGDVVLVDDPEKPGRPLTHRIYSKNDNGTFVTKGDANDMADSDPVHADQILGRGRLVIPLVGRVALWQSSDGRLLAASFTIALAIVLRDLLSIGADRRRYVPRHLRAAT